MRLLFLGRLQDLAGGAERTVTPAAEETVATLVGRLEPALGESLRSPRVRVAVNGVLVADLATTPLGEGDEVAFLPPVSGG